jgi:NNP family nitrate/nitrite transporter-like MFS transporter
MNNKLVAYFERYYAMPNEVAGPLGATFSLMNLFARSWGGILSDWLAVKKGLRGRIAGMYIVQSLEGLMCIFLGLVTVNFDSPDEHKFAKADPVNSTWSVDNGITYTFSDPDLQVTPCGSDLVRSPEFAWVDGEWTVMPVKPRTFITVFDPNPDCVHNQDTLPWTLVCIVLFSICVQMAEGLHFGIVPYISRPALGVVSGMVGAGGNAGALISGQFIVSSKNPLDDGFITLGWIIIVTALLMHFIYFPDEGGILTPPGLPFDPQLVKAAQGQKGADEIDFGKAKPGRTVVKTGDNVSV